MKTLDEYAIEYIAGQTKGRSPDAVVAWYVQNLIFKNREYLDRMIELYKLPDRDLLRMDAQIQKIAAGLAKKEGVEE